MWSNPISLWKGGEHMDMIFSLLELAVKVVVKVVFTTLTKHAISRIKEKAAPISSRDDLVD